VPGYDVRVLDSKGRPVVAGHTHVAGEDDNAMGNIVVKLPLPPGTMLTY
jgi:acyl-coenzyme A synthetase/AMP-(fatty) acid ligase